MVRFLCWSCFDSVNVKGLPFTWGYILSWANNVELIKHLYSIREMEMYCRKQQQMYVAVPKIKTKSMKLYMQRNSFRRNKSWNTVTLLKINCHVLRNTNRERYLFWWWCSVWNSIRSLKAFYNICVIIVYKVCQIKSLECPNAWVSKCLECPSSQALKCTKCQKAYMP